MTPAELCLFLTLPVDTGVHAVRSRVACIASANPRLGSTPAQRDALAQRLGLRVGASSIAIQRTAESVLATPLRTSVVGGPARTMVIGEPGLTIPRGATLGELDSAGLTIADLEASGLTLGELAGE
ncbi:MAG TPA: hypothetical protein VMG12_36645 [Polyangiaceae bacterium]|nr:hypothetical protein [Polyangiaceae bacterium]